MPDRTPAALSVARETERWTPPDHSGPAMKAAAEMIAKDFEEAAMHLERGIAVCRLLEQRTLAVNGTSGVVRAQTNQFEEALKKLRAEAAEVPKKMLGAPKTEIHERVDTAHLEKVAAARAMP